MARKIKQGTSNPRPCKFDLGPWKFSDSSLAGFWNFEYFMGKVGCWGPIIFFWATKIVILGSPADNDIKNAKFCPWIVIMSKS